MKKHSVRKIVITKSNQSSFSGCQLHSFVVPYLVDQKPQIPINLIISFNASLCQVDLPHLISLLPPLCTLLNEINLSHNNLSTLSDIIPLPLLCLKELNLSHNRLSSVPTWICEATSLRTLRINDNLITTLDSRLISLPRLKKLALHHNPCVKFCDAACFKLNPRKLLELALSNSTSESFPPLIGAHGLTSTSPPIIIGAASLPEQPFPTPALSSRISRQRSRSLLGSSPPASEIHPFSQRTEYHLFNTSSETWFEFHRPLFGVTRMASRRFDTHDPQGIELREIIRSGTLDQIAKFFAKTTAPPIDIALADGKTFLHHICSPNISSQLRIQAIQWAYRNGAIADLCDAHFCTPLHRAAQISCVGSFLAFLEVGFSPIVPAKTGSTPVHDLLAGYRSNPSPADLELLKVILNHDSVISTGALFQVDLSGEAPIFYCFNPAILEAVFELSIISENLSQFVNHAFQSPYHSLIQKLESGLIKDDEGTRKCLYRFFEVFHPHLRAPDSRLDSDPNEGRAFLEACAKGDLLAVQRLLSCSSSLPSAPLSSELSPLLQLRTLQGYLGVHLAILNKNIAVTQYLIKISAIFIDSRTWEGSSPLHLAVQAGSIHLARFLCENGAKLSQVDARLHSPVHYAVYVGDIAFLRLFLNHSSRWNALELNQCDLYGWTALNHACISNNSHVIDLLLGCGSDFHSVPPVFVGKTTSDLLTFFTNSTAGKSHQVINRFAAMERSLHNSGGRILNLSGASLVDQGLISICQRLCVLHPELRHLDISDNQISRLPYCLLQLVKLQDICLRGNPLSDNRWTTLPFSAAMIDWKSTAAPILTEIRFTHSEAAYNAASALDWTTIQNMIDSRFLPELSWDESGSSIIHNMLYAKGNIQASTHCLKSALAAGFDLDAPNPFTGHTPLHLTASLCCTPMMFELLKNGANPYSLTYLGENFLHIFVSAYLQTSTLIQDRMNVLNHLIKSLELIIGRVGTLSSILNGQTLFDFATPLHRCFNASSTCPIEHVSSVISTLLMFSDLTMELCDSSFISISDLITSHFPSLLVSVPFSLDSFDSFQTRHDSTALIKSCITGQYSTFVRICSQLSDLELMFVTDPNNWNSLHLACRWNRPRIVTYLLQRLDHFNTELASAFINARVGLSVKGATALHIAAHFGHDIVVQYLLDTNCCEIDSLMSDFSFSPLSLACAGSTIGHPRATRLLIQHGARAGLPIFPQKFTPIFFCCYSGNFGSILEIAALGFAHALILDRTGRSPLDYAKKLLHRADLQIPNLTTITKFLGAVAIASQSVGKAASSRVSSIEVDLGGQCLNTAAVDALLLPLVAVPKLRRLNLSNNLIVSLPPNLQHLTQLRFLDLRGNFLEGYEGKLADRAQNAANFCSYLQNVITNPPLSTSTFESLHVVGARESGKTSLCRALGEWVETDRSLSPRFQSSSVRINDHASLQLWEFTDLNLYRAASRLIFNPYTLFLLVISIKSTNVSHLQPWLDAIFSISTQPRIVLVVTQADRQPDALSIFQLIYATVKELCPQLIGAFLVSTLNGSGLRELRDTLQELVESTLSRPILNFIDMILLDYLSSERAAFRLRQKPPILTYSAIQRIVSNDTAFRPSFSYPLSRLSDSLARLEEGCFIIQYCSLLDSGDSATLVVIDPSWAVCLVASFFPSCLPLAELTVVTPKRLGEMLNMDGSDKLVLRTLDFCLATDFLIPSSLTDTGLEKYYLLPLEPHDPYLLEAFSFDAASSVRVLNSAFDFQFPKPIHSTFLFSRRCTLSFLSRGLLTPIFIRLYSLGRLIEAWSGGTVFQLSSQPEAFLLLQWSSMANRSFVQLSLLCASMTPSDPDFLLTARTSAAPTLRAITLFLENLFSTLPKLQWQWTYLLPPCQHCLVELYLSSDQVVKQIISDPQSWSFIPGKCPGPIVDPSCLCISPPFSGPASQEYSLGSIDRTANPAITPHCPTILQTLSLLQDPSDLLFRFSSHPFIEPTIPQKFQSSVPLENTELRAHSAPSGPGDRIENGPGLTNWAYDPTPSNSVDLNTSLSRSGAQGFLDFTPILPTRDVPYESAISAAYSPFFSTGEPPTLLSSTEGLTDEDQANSSLNRFLNNLASTSSLCVNSLVHNPASNRNPGSFKHPQLFRGATEITLSQTDSADVPQRILQSRARQSQSCPPYHNHTITTNINQIAPDLCLTDLESHLIPFNRMTPQELLGIGGFGKVFRSSYLHPCKSLCDVAMKTLDDTSSYNDFVCELTLIASLSHPCIINFIGYSLQPEPAIFLELALGGDLYSYLFDRYGIIKATDTLWDSICRQILRRETAQNTAQRSQEPFESDSWVFERILEAELQYFQTLVLSRDPVLSKTVDALIISCKRFFDEPSTNHEATKDLLVVQLRNMLKSRTPPVSRSLFLRIATDLASALQYLHSMSPPLVHLDLKLLNILMSIPSDEISALAPAPFIRLADFGASRYLENVQIATGLSSIRCLHEFNPRWASPELLSQRGFNTSADIYSYGLILAEILTLRLSFSELDGPFAEKQIRSLVLAGERPSLPVALSKPIESLIVKCWSGEPAARLSAGDILKELTQICRDEAPELLSLLRLEE